MANYIRITRQLLFSRSLSVYHKFISTLIWTLNVNIISGSMHTQTYIAVSNGIPNGSVFNVIKAVYESVKNCCMIIELITVIRYIAFPISG